MEYEYGDLGMLGGISRFNKESCLLVITSLIDYMRWLKKLVA